MISTKNPLATFILYSATLHILVITILSINKSNLDLNWEKVSPEGRISFHFSQPEKSATPPLVPVEQPKQVIPKQIQPIQKIVEKSLPVTPKKFLPIKAEKVTSPSASENSTNKISETKVTDSKPTATSKISAEARTNYESILAHWLERYRSYPSRALRRRITGSGVLYVKIDQNGKVLKFNLEQSTKHQILDEAIVTMLKKATPLPKIPKEFKLSEFEFAVPVTFKID